MSHPDKPTRKELDRAYAQTQAVYIRHAEYWDLYRPKTFNEKPWLDKLLAGVPAGAHFLDLGCGGGAPIAQYAAEQGHSVTGIDFAPIMLEIARRRLPQASWIEGDMRTIELRGTFDAIVSWDAFFHLTQNEQRALLPRLMAALATGGRLLLTIGDRASEVTGHVEGEPVYHASLAPEEYRALIERNGGVADLTLNDPATEGRSYLLATKTGE